MNRVSEIGNWVLGALLATTLFSQTGQAGTKPDKVRSDHKGSIRIVAGAPDNPIWTLEAEDAPLGQVLTELSRSSGAKLHFSVLPRETVTATCANASIEGVLRCLLGNEVDIVAKTEGKANRDQTGTGMSPELWVLGSTYAKVQSGQTPTTSCGTVATHGDNAKEKAENSGKLLITASTAHDATTRAEALSRLITEAQSGDPEVRAGLERALADQSGDVRAQAVYGLARREGPQMAPVLQDALRDQDPSVRLMAVDSAWNDENGSALLREALLDADETVREAAAMKLEERGETSTTQP